MLQYTYEPNFSIQSRLNCCFEEKNVQKSPTGCAARKQVFMNRVRVLCNCRFFKLRGGMCFQGEVQRGKEFFGLHFIFLLCQLSGAVLKELNPTSSKFHATHRVSGRVGQRHQFTLMSDVRYLGKQASAPQNWTLSQDSNRNDSVTPILSKRPCMKSTRIFQWYFNYSQIIQPNNRNLLHLAPQLSFLLQFLTSL